VTTVRIGLTGPIGCGKSTVAAWLAAAGATVVDADEEARAVTDPGGEAHDAVLAAFGPSAVGPDGGLDRARLAARVFADPAALERLERIVHPAVRARILARIARAEDEGVPAVVIEAIKLVEGGLATICDEVWLVDCAPATQKVRLTRRGMSEADQQRRIDAQAGLVDRGGALASRTLTTDGSLEGTQGRALRAYAEALERMSSGRAG
jgi:dephospho-CoA kinase